MDALRAVAEARIREAIEDGEFDDLPGRGRPLRLPDDSRVPPELRASYGVLRNAGCLPEEMELSKSLLRLRDLIEACDDEAEGRALRAHHARESLRLELLMDRRRGSAEAVSRYGWALAPRLGLAR